jgi:CheY-like chemotaxis protein
MFNLADKSILLVDDSTIMRLILVMNLKRLLGVRVTEAVNGHGALTKLENSRYDLVLADMVMPEMDDAELIRQVLPGSRATFPISSSRQKAKTRTGTETFHSVRMGTLQSR